MPLHRFLTSPAACLAATTLCLALLSASANSIAAGVYKWRDADGKLHFSDKPPPDIEAESVEISTQADPHTADRLNQMKDQAAASAEKRAEAKAEAAEKAKESEEVARHCERSRETLRKLQISTRQQYTTEDGERAFIDEAKRQEWMKKAREEIEKHCR